MKSKHQLFFVLFLICILFFSCEQPKNEVPVQEYSTPTIKGMLSLPAGSTVNTGDIYVKVIDSTGATAKVQKANSDKTFVVQGLNADMSYSILFSSVEPEFTNRAISRDPDKSNGVGGWIHDVKPAIKEGNDIGSVKLKPLGTIRGKALIDGKSEHYDTTVYIPGTSYIAMTNADGTFAIYNVPEGNYTLRYTHEGYMPVMKDGVNLVCPENAETPEIAVEDEKLVSNTGTVEGIALFDGLADNSGISVKLESEDKTQSSQASTSEDGSYVLNSVKPGVYRVVVSAAGYITMSSGYFSVEPATVTTVPEQVVLFRNIGSVKGNVKLSDNQSGNAGIAISFVSSNNSFTALTDKDGYFSRSLKPGSYTVTASYPGYTSQSLDITVTENSLTEINLPSLPLASGAVAGFVVLSGSEDYSGVVITLTNSTAMTESYTAVTASDGSFRFTGLSKGGTYLLTYSKDGYVPDNSKSVDVTVGSVANAGSVTLKSTFATVKGTIQLEGASSYENVSILLKNDNNQYTSTTDQNGGYVINRILPGTYTLLASKDGYVTGQITEIVIEPSSDKQADLLALSVAIRSVTGSVTLELLSDYSGALVTATNLSDNTLIYSAITNSSGAFTLAGMKPGEYSVFISCNGYRSVTLPTINIVSSSTTNLPVTNMLINRGTVSGTATLEGRSSNEGITVELMRGSVVYAETSSDASGNYSFYVPQGNYSGVRYSKTDFASSSVSKNIALFADNYVSMGDTVLQATHNTVKGRVDVLTTDNEGDVTISFDGVASIPAVTTSASGEFAFEHIPVGNYVLRLKRTDCSDITVPVEVKAADVIELGTVTVTPNTATIKGTVILKDGLTSSGVTVSVDMGNGKILSTITDAGGRYEIGGVSIVDEYYVKYEKEGWNTSSQRISPNLYALEVREMPCASMTDTTNPIILDIELNNGSVATRDPNISVRITAFDQGNGIAKMKTSWSDDFSASSWQVFSDSFLSEVIDTTNGEKQLHVYVMDYAGNISDEFVSPPITLTNQIKTLSGELRGSDLHWSASTPYVISEDVIVPTGSVLVIEPGTQVWFIANAQISVRGKMEAIGLDDRKIVFESAGNRIKDYPYDGTWRGMNFANSAINGESGSVMENVLIKNYTDGINGYCDIKKSRLESAGKALGSVGWGSGSDSDRYKGKIYNSTIIGAVALAGEAFNCVFEGNGVSLGNSSYDEDYCVYYGKLNNCYLKNYSHIFFDEVYKKFSVARMVNNTFEKCAIEDRWGGAYVRCSFIEMTAPIEGRYDSSIPSITESNFFFSGVFPMIIINASYEHSAIETGNYWGKERAEQIRKYEANIGKYFDFIKDGRWPGNSSIALADVSGYKTDPIENAGYLGDDFYELAEYTELQ